MTIKEPLTWWLWGLCLVETVVILRMHNERAGNIKWLNPRLYFGVAFLFINVLVPLNILVTGRSSRGIILENEINLMLIAALLSGVSFLIGWRFAFNRGLGVKKVGYDYSPRQYATRALILIPVAVWTIYAYFQGLPSTEWQTVYSFGRASLIVAGLMLAIAGLRAQGILRKTICFGSALSLTSIYLWLAFKQSSRLMFLFLFIAIIALAFYLQKRIRWATILILAGAFIWFFVAYGNARYLSFFEARPMVGALSVSAPMNLNNIYERLFLSGDMDAFENGTLVMQLIPDHEHFFYGGTFATLLVLPIPRAWWPGKPAASVNYMLADYYGFYSDNFAISLQAETYANFYWPGIMVVFGVLGILSSRLYCKTLILRQDPERWIHLGLFSAYIVLVMRGSFHSMTSFYLMIVVWMVASGLMVRILSRLKHPCWRISVKRAMGNRCFL